MPPRDLWVYILASQTRVLYVGITNDLVRRMHVHRSGIFGGFAHQYRVTRLVYIERTNDPAAAIAREKQLKGWRRSRKIALIDAMNPAWDDLWNSCG